MSNPTIPTESPLEKMAGELARRIEHYHSNRFGPIDPPKDILLAALVELRLNSYTEAFALAVECVQFGDAREAAAALAKYANLTIEEMFKTTSAEPISRPADVDAEENLVRFVACTNCRGHVMDATNQTRDPDLRLYRCSICGRGTWDVDRIPSEPADA